MEKFPGLASIQSNLMLSWNLYSVNSIIYFFISMFFIILTSKTVTVTAVPGKWKLNLFLIFRIWWVFLFQNALYTVLTFYPETEEMKRRWKKVFLQAIQKNVVFNKVPTLISILGSSLEGANKTQRKSEIRLYIQKLAKTWIYLTPYVCTERIFDSRPFMHNKIFLKNLL